MSFIQEQENNQEWMIVDEEGNAILPISSVLSISVTAGGSVVSDSIEQGSFTSYNKTTEPLEISMEFAIQGEEWELMDGLIQVQLLKESVSLFSIVTPYYEYENMTLENYNYDQRTENGLGMVTIEATFKEVRETNPAYSQVDASTIQANQQESISSSECSDASDASVEDGGQVSSYEPSSGDAGTAAEEDNRSILKTGGDLISGWFS